MKRLPTMAVDDLGTTGSPIATTFNQLFATNTARDLEGTITHFSLATTNVDATLGRRRHRSRAGRRRHQAGARCFVLPVLTPASFLVRPDEPPA